MTKKFTDLLEMDFRWPKEGDRLLREPKVLADGVAFDGHGPSREAHIWDGYMRAGELLIDACAEEPRERHTLIYPILFNYRHAIELGLKWVLAHYGDYSTVDISDIEHHNLWKLWTLVKKTIIEVAGEDDAIPAVELLIKDFHELDQSGMSLRYSRRKESDEVAKLPDGFHDLDNIRQVMNALGNFFDCADAQLDYSCQMRD